MKFLRTLLLTTILVPGSSFLVPPQAQSLGGKGPVDITSQQLDVQQAKGLAVFTGNVVVTQTGPGSDFRLEAPKVTADFSGGKGTDIKSIEATGGVTITRAGEGSTTEKATGTTATYTPGSQQLVLSGNVTLTRGPSQLSGDKLVYDMASGNARVTNSGGPVKARFVPGAK